jgi:hypothetical protein
VFLISKAKVSSAAAMPHFATDSGTTPALDQFCIVDHWVGDLSNGVFQLGHVSERLHGLVSGADCGLLTLLRCYEPGDRVSILELLEHASSSPSSFCFSTKIIVGQQSRQPVLCVGESSSHLEDHINSIKGVFIYPRLQLDPQGAH